MCVNNKNSRYIFLFYLIYNSQIIFGICIFLNLKTSYLCNYIIFDLIEVKLKGNVLVYVVTVN